MSSIFRSTDPTTWDQVDGIIVNESAPAPSVAGVAANVACIIGRCAKGPINVLTEVGSIGEFQEIFGADKTMGVNQALQGKRFGRLRVIRVHETAADGDGVAAPTDADYQLAIDVAAQENSCNVLFLDSYNAARNLMLKQHASDTQDKMVVCELPAATAVADAVTAAALLRDTDGRVILGFPHVTAAIQGVPTLVGPAAFIASMFSQSAPNEDLASVDVAGYAGSIVALELPLTRADYILLKGAGIAAFEIDPDLGPKLRSGVVTQILDDSKTTIYRRRMADFLTDSVGRFLKNYQNVVNSATNRSLVKGAIVSFVQKCVTEGLLPGDSEVKNGKASIVDVDSLNTDSTIAQGFFKILWRQRIYSSMRYIVLQAEIGTSVVVSEQ